MDEIVLRVGDEVGWITEQPFAEELRRKFGRGPFVVFEIRGELISIQRKNGSMLCDDSGGIGYFHRSWFYKVNRSFYRFCRP